MYNVSEGGLVGQPLDALVDPPPEAELDLPLLRLRDALAHQLHHMPQLQRRVLGVVVQHLGQHQRLPPRHHVRLDELRPRHLQLLVYLLRTVQPHLQTQDPTYSFDISFFFYMDVWSHFLPSLRGTGSTAFSSVESGTTLYL